MLNLKSGNADCHYKRKVVDLDKNFLKICKVVNTLRCIKNS